MESLICKICKCTNNLNDRFVVKEMMFGFKDEFDYFECSECGCIQIVDIPTNIEKYYPTNYYSLGKYDGKRFQGFWGSIYRLRNRASFFRSNLFYRMIHFFSPIGKYEIFQRLGITKKSRILDVGCGNGDFFLYPFKEMGIENVAGCDPFIHENIQYSNALQIWKAPIFEIQGQWDVIIYNHSFEHLPDPFENLLQVKKLLAPNGVCIIRTPTVPCFAWNTYKANWFQLDAPRHFFIHSSKSIQLLSKRVNLKLERTEYDSTHYQFISSENYEKGIPLIHQKFRGSLAMKFQKLKFSRLARELNKKHLGDQAGFILRNEEASL